MKAFFLSNALDHTELNEMFHILRISLTALIGLIGKLDFIIIISHNTVFHYMQPNCKHIKRLKENCRLIFRKICETVQYFIV